MEIFFTLLTVAFGCLIFATSLFFSRLRFSMRKGKFTITKNNIGYLSFSSDFGSFHFKFKEKSFFINSANDKRTISLEELIGIRYVVDDELALYTERFSLKGTADINNLIHWYTIKLVLKDRSEVPVFIAGEFEPINWFARWQSRLEIYLYQRMGLLEDVDAHCRKTLDSLLSCFKNADNELPLI